MSRVPFLNTFSHPDFFESIECFEVKEADFLQPVRLMLTGEWSFRRRQVWFNCSPPPDRARSQPVQGWKIHVSCDLHNSMDILQQVVPVLDRRGINFKFALDRRILQMMNGKTWARQGAGKFITIYPIDKSEFVSLIEELHGVTREFKGIYILSDRRYKDSNVLFYRYGGIQPYAVTNERGHEVSMLVSPDGVEVPDQRVPYFHVPEWETDPFADEQSEEDWTDDEGRIALNEGRYLVKSVLGFSNSGGVYIADDTKTGQEVVIKEARPFVTFTEDCVSLLRKEYRMLSRIAEVADNVAPRAVDFFQDWEHYFLVQEYIQGQSLTSFSASNNITLLIRPTVEDSEKFYADFREIFTQLARILALLHDQGIVFSDLSPNNVVLLTDPLRVRIIDFEGATEVGVDKPSYVFTPGFAYRDQMHGDASNFKSDYFALGAVMHFFLAPFNQIFGIAPRKRFIFLKSVIEDIGFPAEVHELIIALIGNELDQRPTPRQVIEVLERDYELRPPRFSVAGESANASYLADIERICEYCLAVADFERKDRLFPAHASIFHSNPLSLSYGACGVAHGMQKMGQQVPDEVVDWILQPTGDRERYPPGLYMGLGGLAWTLLDLGRTAPAERVMALSHAHPLVYDSHTFLHGMAGWGMTNLKFFLDLQDELYLSKAIEAGERLLDSARESDKGLYWEEYNEVPLGLGHGPSGVSLFWLYLHAVSGRASFLDAGIRALDFDLESAVETREGGLSWRRKDDGEDRIQYPYWKYGTAGVGAALIRYAHFLDEPRYWQLLEKIHLNLDRKYAVFPGMFLGLTGIGETLLDFHHFTGQDRFIESAHKIATCLSLFRIEREEGIAFPGDTLMRICCDLSTGSTGVGRFFHRLVHGGPAPLMLDQVLDTGSGRG